MKTLAASGFYRTEMFRKAAKLFRAFFRREPGDDEIVLLGKQNLTAAIVVGELDGIIYRVDGEAKPLIHRFPAKHRPLLLVSSDGRQIYSVRGRYRFTEQGFVP